MMNHHRSPSTHHAHHFSGSSQFPGEEFVITPNSQRRNRAGCLLVSAALSTVTIEPWAFGLCTGQGGGWAGAQASEVLAAVSAVPAHRDLRLRSGGAPLAHSDGQLKDVS